MQKTLFDAWPEPGDIPDIPGLKYIPEYISTDHQRRLLTVIDQHKWIEELQRRVQHYGFKYSYKPPHTLKKTENLPRWATNIARQLVDDKLTPEISDQLIINEYLPGQGIAPHVDMEECFDETIISISMLSACVMDFIKTNTREKVEILLEPRSAVVLSGEARHKWLHGISPRRKDVFNGQKFERSRRISLTFRKTKES